ncbi:MAG: EamA family transporter [Proteobacteria bacterium]|nr:EamA family transporter [Pseudomonadota bacterium]
MLYLIFSILSSVTIALLVKRNENADLNRLKVLFYNYITISLILLVINLIGHLLFIDLHLFVLSIIVGFLFAVNFLIYMRLINTSDISLPTLAMRLSLVIPVTLSVILYGESLDFARGVGVLLAIISILMMYNPSEKNKDIILIFFLFLFSGFADFSMKYFEMNFPLKFELSFMMFLFSWAAVFSALFSLVYKRKSGRGEIYNGIILAVPNSLASFFIILALKRVDATVVFPVVNISIIVLSVIGSKLLFNESFSKRKIISFVFGILAIIVLTFAR